MISFKSGIPDEKQLEKINQYRNIGTPEFTAEELYVIQILGTDNLTHRNNSTWSLRTLDSIAKGLIGKDFMFDHDWGSAKDNIQGIIFDATRIFLQSLSPSTKKELTLESYNKEADLDILSKDGYNAVIFSVALESSSDIVSDVVYLRQSDVSIGGIMATDYICPLCNISFSEPECPHLIPDPLLMYYLDIEEDDPDLAPYYVRDGESFDGVELSMVTSGNCPRARILREKDKQRLLLTQFR